MTNQPLTNIQFRILSNGARHATYTINGMKASTFVPRDVYEKCVQTGDDFWFRLWLLPDLMWLIESTPAPAPAPAPTPAADEMQTALDEMLDDVARETECFDGEGMWAVQAELEGMRALEGSGLVSVGQRERVNGANVYWITITPAGYARLAAM